MARKTRAAAAIVGSVLALTLALLLGGEGGAIINPSLQPRDLLRRYLSVVCCRVDAVDAEAGTARLEIMRACKGEPPTGTVTVAGKPGLVSQLRPGSELVAFRGRKRPASKKDQLLLYDGKWMLGTSPDPQTWRLDMSADEGDVGAGTIMAGTWNGSVESLGALMDDVAAGRDYLPSRPSASFGSDRIVDELDAPVRALALHDIDGDGSLDIYACSDAGDRVYLQLEAGEPVDATDVLGLGGIASPSCSFADVNGDGVSDLLAGGVVFLASGDLEDRFREVARLHEDVLTSTFADVDGDGWPDVIVASEDGGLRLFRNTGGARPYLEEKTEEAGLDREECGSERIGRFAAGDVDGDGRVEALFAVGKGLLLEQDEAGRFSAREHGLRIQLAPRAGGPAGDTGGACFASLFGAGALDLAVPGFDSFMLAANRDGELIDVTRYANEISEASLFQLGIVAEDLNADGNVDLYTFTREDGRPNRYHLHRGYGTYMNATKYQSSLFRGGVHERGGCLAAVAGDFDGDGLPDLLLGTAEGVIVLKPNLALKSREPEDHPTAEQAALESVGLLKAIVQGDRGVLGARVVLRDEAGGVVGRRDLGAGTPAGCRGPDETCMAVRVPGKHTLQVRSSDGHTVEKKVTIQPGGLEVVTVERGD